MGFRTAPAQNTGYNRMTEWPTVNGSGATVNGTNAGAGMNLKSTITPGTSTWHPTVAWMLGFVVVELVVFHALSRVLHL